MGEVTLSPEDMSLLLKLTRMLPFKFAQAVVESRNGNRVTKDTTPDNPSTQWFNLSIPNLPEVNEETKKVIKENFLESLKNIMCIEVSLRTCEGDEMVLEIWTVKITNGIKPNSCSISMLQNHMSGLLKSTLTITRITPAYKLSRSQQKESYIVYHKIYGGKPDLQILGENYKEIKVGEVKTPIGTLVINVVHRTKMAIIHQQQKLPTPTQFATSDIMVKSDHFPADSPRKIRSAKKEMDLSKPLTAGAFVDTRRLEELREELTQQLPPEPPLAWLLAEKEKLDQTQRERCASPAAAPAAGCSRAVPVPKPVGDKCSSLMDFPFANGSPIRDLASFYKQCLSARSASAEWTELEAPTTDAQTLAEQLRVYEEAVPEFDSMLASMLSESELGSDS